MSNDPALPSAFDASTLAVLACPACHGDLYAEDARLICGSCHRGFPIVDGIPALVAERSERTSRKR